MRRSSRIAAAVLPLALAACGSPDPVPPGPATQDEAGALRAAEEMLDARPVEAASASGQS